MPATFVHINKRLDDISIRFPEEQVSVRDAFFPKKPVAHLSDYIAQWNRANILRPDFRDFGVGFRHGVPGSRKASGGIYTTDFGLAIHG